MNQKRNSTPTQIRPLYDIASGTWTYLLVDSSSRKAVLIDPVLEQWERDRKLLKELGVTTIATIETHMHADHITSASLFRESLGTISYVSEFSGAICADKFLKEGDRISFGDTTLVVLETPGHTPCSLSFYLPGVAVFTGDALLVRGCGRTDFQNGDANILYDSITKKLFSLPEETLVYPGHDYQGNSFTSIGEEKQWNPRLANKTKEEFQKIMSELQLAPPKKIQVAVKANQACGELQ